MERLTSIVVAVDLSPCSLSALDTAARLATRDGATLHVVHVIETLIVADLSESLGMPEAALRVLAEDDARRTIESRLAQSVTAGDVRVEIGAGVPVKAVRRVLSDVHADLLVMGVHGQNGPGRGPGGFATKAIRLLPVDVLLVREGHSGPFLHVLGCTDFSDTARRAVAQAVATARGDGARFTLLHVYWGPWNRKAYGMESSTSPKLKQEYQAFMRARLTQESARHADDLIGILHCDQLIDTANHGEAIARHAKESMADLIVLGTRGRTTVHDLFVGSTAERVLRNTSSSLLAVKPEAVLLAR